MKTRNAAVVWGIQGVYLTAWAAAGVIVWLFVRAMESIRTRATAAPALHQRRVSLGSVLGRLVWGIVVWYVILWPAGVVRVSPVEVASSLAAIPGLFRG